MCYLFEQIFFKITRANGDVSDHKVFLDVQIVLSNRVISLEKLLRHFLSFFFLVCGKDDFDKISNDMTTRL